jgi:predicted O-methyltransferase YrrM
MQKLPELGAVLHIVEELRPRAVLEIGTQAGGTLYCWCKLADPAARIVSVDLPGGEYGGGYTPERAEEMRLLFPSNGQALHLIQADSHSPDTLAQVRSLVGSLDFLFIDGDHTYEGVKRDFEMYAPLVRPGGVIALHDICESASPDSKVDVLWREIKERYRHQEFVVPPAGWGGMGVLWP